MATQLFFLNTVADTHLGTDNAILRGSTGGWGTKALATSRGSGVTASLNLPTATGLHAGVEIQDSGGLNQEWISPPVAADVTISGTITANIWASESNMSANVAINVVIEIIRANATATRNSNTLVEIVRSTNVTELAVTTRAVNNFTTGMTSGGYTGQTLNRGDRLRVRIFGDDVGTMASGFTFNASWGGTTAAADGDSYVTFTENITFEPTATSDQTSQAANVILGISAAATYVAQPFVATGNTVRMVAAWVVRVGAAHADNMVVEIQGDSGGSPDGSAIGTVATIVPSSLGTATAQYTWPCNVTGLSTSSTYWIVFRRSGAVDGTNYFQFRYQNAAVGGWSPYKIYNGATWSAGSGPLTIAFNNSDTTTLYLTDTASAVSTASVDRESWTSRGAGVQTDVTTCASGWIAPIQVTDTAGGTVVDWFTRPLTAFTLTGMAVANIRALESNAAANASLRCEIARVEGDGTSPTVWCSWCCAPTGTDNGELTTSEVARTINLSGDDLAITNGQRLRIRLYNDDISSAAMGSSANSVTLYYAGTSGGASGDTYLTFPQTLTEYASGPFTYTKAGYGKEAG